MRRPASVIFQAELPVPVTNLEIYEHVYVLEQWLRRIAFASLVAKFGLQWRGALPEHSPRTSSGASSSFAGACIFIRMTATTRSGC